MRPRRSGALVTTLTTRQRARLAKRYIAIRRAVASAVAEHAPEVAGAEWFKQLLDDCHAEADRVALWAAVAAPLNKYDATYLSTFAATLRGLLAMALAERGKLDPTA
jgi:hypothetical protein